MKTAMLWALWTFSHHGGAVNTVYFETNTECLRVAAILIKQDRSGDKFMCIQAEYVIPEGAPNALLKSK